LAVWQEDRRIRDLPPDLPGQGRRRRDGAGRHGPIGAWRGVARVALLLEPERDLGLDVAIRLRSAHERVVDTRAVVARVAYAVVVAVLAPRAEPAHGLADHGIPGERRAHAVRVAGDARAERRAARGGHAGPDLVAEVLRVRPGAGTGVARVAHAV